MGSFTVKFAYRYFSLTRKYTSLTLAMRRNKCDLYTSKDPCILKSPAFLYLLSHRCLIKWLEVRKVCPLCNMPVLQLAQQAGSPDPPVPIQQPLPGIENVV